jgi:transposase
MESMDLIELGKIISDDRRSFEFLWSKLGSPSCPYCGSVSIYFMGGRRVRCSKCHSDIWPLKGTRFSKMKIPCPKWLAILKLFELSISVRKASKEVKLSYKTTLKAFNMVRRAILHELARHDEVLMGEIEADESYFGGRRKGKRGRGSRNKSIVFGILERKGKVSISIVKDVSAETLMEETVKKVRRGSIVYTDRWRSYDSLMFCGYRHLSIDHQHKFKRGKVYINGIEGFWSFARERLIKYHGISKEKFLYYIKEMEWRYNNRDKELYSLLIDYMLGVDPT